MKIRTILLSTVLAVLTFGAAASEKQVDSLFEAWRDASSIRSIPAANAFMAGLYEEDWTDSLIVFPSTASRVAVAPEIYYWMAD